ncbi:SURF1 family protein [Halomonas sp. E19]|uniref:SURF1 family protein n=1 Tax=Halomonas sp. E19 TaxID=3397247 RepID=UPI0040345033
MPSWRLGLWYLFWLLLVALGLALGLWQWERADDKRDYLTQLDEAPTLEAPAEFPPEGARLTLRGEYLPEHTLFLDNRTHDGRLGVAALTPLRTEDGRVWLVQRGFMATGPSRAMPRVDTPEGVVTLYGRWQRAGSLAPLFGPNQEEAVAAHRTRGLAGARICPLGLASSRGGAGFSRELVGAQRGSA